MTKERDLQAAVWNALKHRERVVGDIWSIHVPNEGKRDPRTGYLLRGQGMRAGAPDIIVWMRGGRNVCIELKAVRGTLSPAQQDFQAAMERLGHEYHVVKAKDCGEAVTRVHDILEGRDNATR